MCIRDSILSEISTTKFTDGSEFARDAATFTKFSYEYMGREKVEGREWEGAIDRMARIGRSDCV